MDLNVKKDWRYAGCDFVLVFTAAVGIADVKLYIFRIIGFLFKPFYVSNTFEMGSKRAFFTQFKTFRH